jgi:hypothetical protein
MLTFKPLIPAKLAKAMIQLNLLKTVSEKDFINKLPTDSPEPRPCPKKEPTTILCILSGIFIKSA